VNALAFFMLYFPYNNTCLSSLSFLLPSQFLFIDCRDGVKNLFSVVLCNSPFFIWNRFVECVFMQSFVQLAQSISLQLNFDILSSSFSFSIHVPKF